MPKARKLSYKQRRERNNETRRLSKIVINNNVDCDAATHMDSPNMIEIIQEDNVHVTVQDVERRNKARITECISDVRRQLDDMCINAFLKVLKNNTAFEPQDPLLYQGIHWYQRVEANKRDIQVLYGGEIGADKIGHWTCIYYDGSMVHVYDTLHRRLLPLHLQILERLYGSSKIVYEDVQIQPDGVSCGVLACAIATSLTLGINPTTQRYLIDNTGNIKSTYTLRCHLLKVLDLQVLIDFPTVAVETLLVNNQQERIKTYASICQTVSQPNSHTSHVLEAGSRIDNEHRIQPDGSAVEKSADRKRKWWACHKDKINQERRKDYAVKQAKACKNYGVSYSGQSDITKNQPNKESATGPGVSNILQPSKFALDTEIQNATRRAKYAIDSNKIKAQKKAKYAANPEIKKIQERIRYGSNSEIKKKKERAKYAANPEVKKNQEKKKYAANPEVKKNQENKKYAANPEVKKNQENKRYAANPEVKKNQEKAKYARNPEVKKIQEKTKYSADPTNKKETNKKYYYKCKEKKEEIRKLVTSKNILKKYRHMNTKSNIMKFLGSIERCTNILVTKIGLSSGPKSRIEAEKLIKWCIHSRQGFVSNVKKTLANLKRNAEVSLIRAAESSSDLPSKTAALCGDSKHTGSSEAYFADTAYNGLTIATNTLVTTATGQITNVLPVCPSKHVHKSWVCSEMCAKPDSHTIDRLQHLLEVISNWTLSNIRNNVKQINICSANKSGLRLGHSPICYTRPVSCNSKLLPVQILSAHYPRMRYFARQIYEVIKFIAKINVLDNALIRGDLKLLTKISNETKEKAQARQPCLEEITLDEDEIISSHSQAFEALVRRSMDSPRLVCVSCEKLCCRRDVGEIHRLRKPLSGSHWSKLKQYIDSTNNDTGFICHYCLDKFRHGELPPTCVLNQLAVKERPVILSILNDYEKILIQRAKAFQIVQRMGTVSKKKNLPHSHKIQKVKGRTFHLPLPLEETLKKLPLPTDAINPNHELSILVCGIPNKSKIVWSKLVDVRIIHEALTWLKANNQFYSQIRIPENSELILQSLKHDVEVQIQSESGTAEGSADRPLECNDEESVLRKAMLTQITDPDTYCEQFTIYPIHEDRENKTASALYQMLKVNEAPLSNWDKSLDVMCFPDLYPHGINGQHQDRTVRLREYDFIKSRIMSKHACFRLNIQYIFYLLNDSNIRQLNSGIFQKLNIINPREKLNARNCLELMSTEQLEGNLTTIFGRLRNTDQYWRKPRNDLTCMVQNYGPATWFLTLSPSEWMWEDLAEYIRQVNGPEMARMSTSQLIASDPVSTSRYLDNKFQAMLKFITSSDCPIGQVTHYFWRREYQGRGTQHFHLLIWIKDAPVIGESSTEEVAKFITKYATCRMPDKNISPTLYRRVDTHQRHSHNDYCMRNKKNKHGYSKVCRFGFPRPVTDSMIMRDVAISIAGRKQLKSKSRLYDLPRSDEEAYINDYNPTVLTAWEGNMDIQFIGEKSTILNYYCTKYTTKTESNNVTEIFDEINSTKSLCSRLWSVALRSLNNRECGALEAADTLLGISLYGTDADTTIKWLDINQVRNRKLKPYKTVQGLKPESTDIFWPSLIDDHYPNRPEQLESVHLYEFAKWYEVTKIKPVNSDVEVYELGRGLYLKKRSRGYLINHYKYNVNVQPEKYFYALLLIFKPWRDVDELKCNCDSYAEAFDKSKLQLMEALKYHERMTDIQKGFDYMKGMIEEKMENLTRGMSVLSKESEDNMDNPLGFEPVEANVAMQEFNQVEEHLAEVDVHTMIAGLNSDQKRIFDDITNILNADTNTEILRLFISGAGGTGKSYLIKTIRCWTKQILGKATAVTAPTGLAAFNIDGLTIHRLFQLPIEHGGTPKYKELSDQVLKILRQELKDVVLFIIDEVSMISNVTFAYIHLRLCEIFDTNNREDGWFGGKHIILLGDLLQLPPVNDHSPFVKLSKDKVQKYIGSVGIINLWSHLFTYDELTTNMRQQNDSSYQEILTRVRFGMSSSDDIDILQSRKLKFVTKTVNGRLDELCDYINKLPVDTVCLFATRNQCDILNTAMLAKIQSNEIKLIAEDTVDCVPYLKKKISKLLNKENEDSSRTAGLSKTITIKIGAKIMVRRNIDITGGLVNGTIGHVTSISKAINDHNKVESLTIALSSGKEYTIERISTKFEVMDGAFIFRRQFPLSLSYGITIHKSQGLSLTSVVMDIGNSIFTSGQAYVALSRVTSLEGLHVINLDPNSIKVQESALVEYNRLRKQFRPELPTIDVSRISKSKIPDTIWSIPKHALNAQVELESPTSHNDTTNVVGIENVDNVSCYANATVQCIFHCPIILRQLSQRHNNDPLELLAHAYLTGDTNLSSLSVREFSGEQFKTQTQQDAAEFLTALCTKSDILRNAIEHQLITTTRCSDCGFTTKNQQPNYIVPIPIENNCKQKSPSNLQNLVKSVSRWSRIDSACENCHNKNKLQNITIASVTQILVLQLMLFSYTNNQATKIRNFKVNAIPTSKVVLDGHNYKVNSAIFHYGENLESGHYTVMLKNKLNNWLSVNDMQVRKMIWPRGAKDAYLLILNRI